MKLFCQNMERNALLHRCTINILFNLVYFMRLKTTFIHVRTYCKNDV